MPVIFKAREGSWADAVDDALVDGVADHGVADPSSDDDSRGGRGMDGPREAALATADEPVLNGSEGHAQGRCKPCSFYHTKGCTSGATCAFCHLCPPGEKQRRRRRGHALRSRGLPGSYWEATPPPWQFFEETCRRPGHSRQTSDTSGASTCTPGEGLSRQASEASQRTATDGADHWAWNRASFCLEDAGRFVKFSPCAEFGFGFDNEVSLAATAVQPGSEAVYAGGLQPPMQYTLVPVIVPVSYTAQDGNCHSAGEAPWPCAPPQLCEYMLQFEGVQQTQQVQ